MNVSDIKIGMRVRVKRNNMTALIVGTPEYYNGRSHLVRIKYENSTRYEYMVNRQLESLPIEDQYPAHGGTHVKPKGEL